MQYYINTILHIIICSYDTVCTYYLSIPDDHNRIVLNAIPGFDVCQGEFINACYVEVRKEKI